MNYSVMDIAAWFVHREAMNHEKLQCLLYLSYAWFLTLNKKELFKSSGFEALPVMIAEMSVHQKYHHLGKKKIHYIRAKMPEGEIALFLESVYAAYGAADEQVLCGYLRQSDPYLKARKNERGFQISGKDMVEYYARQSADQH